MLKIDKLSIKYGTNTIISNISLLTQADQSLGIVIPNQGGKTSLFNIIKKGDLQVTNSYKKVIYLDHNIESDIFNSNTILKDFGSISPKKRIAIDIITHYANMYHLDIELLNKSYLDLSPLERVKAFIVAINILKPDMIMCDNSFLTLKNQDKKRMWRYLIMLKKELNYSLIYLTHSLNEAIYTEKLSIINKQEIVSGPIKEVLTNTELLINNHLTLPFYVELSSQLKLYGMIDKVCLNRKELGDNLWK